MEAVGKFLGVPERWDFGIEDEFICQLGYGDFELNLRTQTNRVEVERIWIELWITSGDRPVPKTDRIRLTQRIFVELGQFAAGLPLSAAKRALESLNLSYEEFASNDGSEVVRRLTLPTHADEILMIHPSRILNFKHRLAIEFAIRIFRIKEDTFVFICRDFGISAGEISFLIEYYYKRTPSESKRIAFRSGAWGERGDSMVDHSNAAFDHFAGENKEKDGPA